MCLLRRLTDTVSYFQNAAFDFSFYDVGWESCRTCVTYSLTTLLDVRLPPGG